MVLREKQIGHASFVLFAFSFVMMPFTANIIIVADA